MAGVLQVLEPEPEPERQLPAPNQSAARPSVLRDSLDDDPTPLVRWLTIHGAASSRKHALSLLAAGSVTVNGEPCVAPAQVVYSSRDEIKCSGETIVRHRRHRHVLLHKPRGHLTTRRAVRQLKGGGVEEDSRPTVYSLLDAESQSRHCVAVGRLDVDTTGALLFTTNGMLAHRLLAPDFHVAKLYRATLRTMEPLSAEAIAQLAAGVTLRSKGQKVCRGIAQNVPGRPGVVELKIDSGAFHQVKHMLALVGRPLARLHRVAFANLVTEEEGTADSTELPCGHCRELTDNEVMEIYSLADAAVNAFAGNACEDAAAVVAVGAAASTGTVALS